MRALKTTLEFLLWLASHPQYVRRLYENLRNFPSTWSIKPINSAGFWEIWAEIENVRLE
ncbi:uncharacterized protein CCOS01_01899 [Colletotrichum costaricense]|uniref:Uncharacterized protein n=1 Tax=Colletotrichum costaricense TaxID=1209916 RepID=A0AAI9Z825_9PEZI|nr:uncharacterized protein CCOS01_01899 [Colletotrichum costaricense]KAK1536579.1 hypothetical protein CCOS01_01899 [Colletotrichum costaricense]